MDRLVDEISYRYPSKHDRGYVNIPQHRRPRACIALTLDDGSSRELWVPVRVARQLEKDEPALPAPTSSVRDAVLVLERQCCFAMLAEMQSRREHSSFELSDKLDLYGFKTDIIDAVVARSQELKITSDERFMRGFIDARIARGWGRRKIEIELKRRGCDPTALLEYPDAYFSETGDLERAEALLARKSVPESRAFEKLVRHLMSKGFSYNTAAQAARSRIKVAGEGSHV